MYVRQAALNDILDIYLCNVFCLPENYSVTYYKYHLLTWPQINYVAVDERERIVGYVLARIELANKKLKEGHITSLAVLRKNRRCGLARMLMVQSLNAMVECFQADIVSLQARRSNHAALHLYEDVLGFKIEKVLPEYYSDGEDGIVMTCNLKEFKLNNSKSCPVDRTVEKKFDLDKDNAIVQIVLFEDGQ